MFEQLLAAIKANNNLEALRLIEAMEISELSKKDSKGYSALHHACAAFPSKEVVVALLNQMQAITVNAKASNGQTALHQAATHGNAEIAALLSSSSKFNSSAEAEYDGLTAMHLAAQRGYTKIIEILSSDLCVKKDLKGNNPLHLAAQAGYRETTEKICSKFSSNINELNNEGLTALHLAVLNYRTEVTEFLIDRVISRTLDIKYNDDSTILHYLTSERAVKKILTEKPQMINAKSNNGYTVFHKAASYNNKILVETLLKQLDRSTADVLINYKDTGGNTALHIAVSNSRTEIADLLFDRTQTENLSLKCSTGRTLLHYATEANIDKLLSSMTSEAKNNKSNDSYYYTALHVAVIGGRYSLVQKLLNNLEKTTVFAKDYLGYTVLHHAPSKEIAELLLEYFDRNRTTEIINHKGTDGITAFHQAAKTGRTEVVKLLLGRIELKHAISKDNTGSTAIHLAAKAGYNEVVKVLLEKFLISTPEILNIKDNSGFTLLHYATSIEIFKKLYEVIPEAINARASNGYTVLHQAVSSGRTEIVKLLVNEENNSSIKLDQRVIDTREGNGNTALHLALMSHKNDIANILLTKVSEQTLNFINYDGYTALHHTNSERIAKLLLARMNPEIVAIKANNGYTALHQAVYNGYEQVTKLLLNKLGDKQKDNLGNTVLHIAAQRGHSNIAKLLFDKLITEVDAKGRTALHVAASKGNMVLAELLIEQEPNILSAKDYNGQSALHAATDCNQSSVVEMLVYKMREDGTSLINQKDNFGYSPLSIASLKGATRIVEIFVNTICGQVISESLTNVEELNEYNKIDILLNKAAQQLEENIRHNLDDKSAIILQNLKNVIAANEIEPVESFVEIAQKHLQEKIGKITINSNQQDIHALDIEGKTKLHWAAEWGQYKLVEILLKSMNSTFINAVAKDGSTALHSAVIGGNDQIIKALLTSMTKETIISQDNNGLTALHYAAYKGNYIAASSLYGLGYFELTNAVANNGMSALHFATLGGDKRIISDLLKYLSPELIELDDNNGRSALHLAGSLLVKDDKIFEYIINASNPEKIKNVLEANDPVYSTLTLEMIKNQITLLDKQIKTSPATIDNYFKKGNLLFVLGKKDLAIKEYYRFSEGKIIDHIACQRNFKVVDWLIKEKPELLNIIDQQGQTLLHRIVANSSIKTIKFLLEKMSLETINVKDKKGFTALDLVSQKYVKTIESKDIKLTKNYVASNSILKNSIEIVELFKNKIAEKSNNGYQTNKNIEVKQVSEVIYNNKLLNHFELLQKALELYNINKILDLSKNLDQDLVNQAIITDNPEMIIAGLISLD